MKTTTETADLAYERNIMEALGICEDLADAIRENWPAPESDGINWGHVGSAAAMVERLRAVRAFIRHEEV